MQKEYNRSLTEKSKIQTEVTPAIQEFLGDYKVKTYEDLVALLKHIHSSLEFRNYNDATKEYADSIQWKRTASEIVEDGYVYKGKACSDLALIFIALCKAASVDAQLLKLIRLDGKSTHTIVEIQLEDGWYRLDTSNNGSVPFKGYLADEQVWNKNWEGGWKVWKRGPDLWSMGLDSIDSEDKVREE
ncbi:MAG: hypothetical protein AAB400_03455 [Patescibacteria group bacterium]